MPQVRFQPHVLLLTAVVLLKKVCWAPAVLPAGTMGGLGAASALSEGGDGGGERLLVGVHGGKMCSEGVCDCCGAVLKCVAREAG